MANGLGRARSAVALQPARVLNSDGSTGAADDGAAAATGSGSGSGSDLTGSGTARVRPPARALMARVSATGILDDQLDGEFVADALGFRRQRMRKRCGLDRFGDGALLAQLSTTIAREDLLGEGFDRVDRQNGRRHIMATVSREHVRSFAGPHHEPLSTDTFKRRTKRRHQTHNSASCSVSTSSN